MSIEPTSITAIELIEAAAAAAAAEALEIRRLAAAGFNVEVQCFLPWLAASLLVAYICVIKMLLLSSHI